MNMFFRITLDYDTLANEIVGKIPEKHFVSKTDTFLDPAFAGGQFLKAVARRLNKYGHSLENIRSRLFGYEDSVAYLNHPANYSTAMIANLSVVKYLEFLVMDEKKFDVVLGNPPYQQDDGGSSIKLWKKFIIKASTIVEKNGIISMVTPVSWSKPTRGVAKGDDMKMLDVMYNNTVIKTNMNTNSFFPGVGINTGYWIMKLDGIKSDKLYFPIDRIHGSILDKLVKSKNPKLNLVKYVATVWTRGITRKDKIDGEYKIPCVEKSTKFSYVKEDSEYRKVKKIHIPRNFGYDFFPDNGEYGLGYQAEVIELSDNENTVFAMNYLTSKLVSFILKFKPWIPQPDYALLEMLPSVDFSKDWTDDELYTHFGLTQEEINYIEANVK